ncbi:NAD-dependent protein deacetylase of SIR2 family [Mucinivorans hirudinis]|uniref:protein acetyllysine N-acetyltransferase n=1 Tax=Mucinivorans hirudinis TaxID=1433126 RepID=A0A060R813_9BACT|nr:NAD-dependent protein deacetylase of SIR2 family [Mucinivorans hirudinis]
MKNIVIFTGAGVSAESGIATFRDSDGLWANYSIEDVCTPQALARNRGGVIDFYNMRRREVLSKKPNDAHLALKRLENHFHTTIVTQNVDDLHERAGSHNVIHLHGEIGKLCSSRDTSKTVKIEGWEQRLDERHADGSLLRPFIVFFGEQVPMLEEAIDIVQKADIFVVIGTSLQVYPAASLLCYLREAVPVYVVDPKAPPLSLRNNPIVVIRQTAAKGVPELVNGLIEGSLA